MENKRKKIETGDKFNRLTVLERTDEKYKSSKAFLYKCRCDCGNIKLATSTMLKLGRVKSCGCLQKEISADFMKELRVKQDVLLEKLKQELKDKINFYTSLKQNIGALGLEEYNIRIKGRDYRNPELPPMIRRAEEVLSDIHDIIDKL